MKWSDLGKLIKPTATILADVVSGGTAGAVIGMVAKAVGATEETPDAIAEAMKTNPEAAANLMKLENEHEQVLRQMALQLQLADLQDLANARARDIEVRRLGFRNVRADILAYSAMAELVVAFLVLAYVPIPQTAHDALVQLIGTLGAIVLMVYSFDFGSSYGSRLKDESKANGQS